MLLMIFVNDLWSITGYPEWLGHAKGGQDMLGLADVVFPCFLFTVGMSIPYALERRFDKKDNVVDMISHILTRTLALLIMGVYLVNTESGISPETGMSYKTYRLLLVISFFMIWNVYPKTQKQYLNKIFSALKVLGILLLLYLGIIFRDQTGEVLSARWWGILGTIGWTYFICAFIYLLIRSQLKYLILIEICLILVCILQTPLINGTAILELPKVNFFNQMLNILHVGNGAIAAFTLGGVILSVLGAKYKDIKPSKKTMWGVLISFLFLISGYVANNYWIISKLARTPPWMFYCIGIAIAAYTCIRWLEGINKIAWFKLIEPAGTSTLTCYLVPYILYAVSVVTLPSWLKVGYMGLLHSLCFSFFTIGVTYLLGRIYIKLKI